MKLPSLGKFKTPVMITGGAIAGYFGADYLGTKVTTMVTHKLTTSGKAVPENLPDYIDYAKIIGGIVINILPKKYKFGMQALVNSAGIGIAVNGGVSLVKRKQLFGITGRNTTYRTYRKVNAIEQNQQNTTNMVGNTKYMPNGQDTTSMLGNMGQFIKVV